MARPRFPRAFSSLFMTVIGVVAWLGAASAPAAAAAAYDILVYGPSLANQNCGGSPLVNEQTVAEDDGQNVTVVDQATWAGMSTSEFAAYDAIVIGDGGCHNSDDDILAGPTGNATEWNPAVTGNITINTFDAFCHYYQSSDTQTGGRALAQSGIQFAASGSGTGLYYSNGCRADDLPPVPSFLVGLGLIAFEHVDGDLIDIVNGAHPAMAGTSEANLSNWHSSAHAGFLTIPSTFEILAQLEEIGEGDSRLPPTGAKVQSAAIDPAMPPVIVAGVADPPSHVPALSTIGLSMLAVLLVGGGALVLRVRNGA